MSAGGAFGGNRGLRPVPPEKGVFPLDHMHECDVEKKDYLSCLKSSGHQSDKCRRFSKKYLECRMAKNLMARQDMLELGFGKETEAEAPAGNESKRIDASRLLARPCETEAAVTMLFLQVIGKKKPEMNQQGRIEGSCCCDFDRTVCEEVH
ncbi:uncharacterized protein J3R85_014918 [Psidium guajava]|nr:uncharacterized protein J3R85_014918 [Psidium guajava]